MSEIIKTEEQLLAEFRSDLTKKTMSRINTQGDILDIVLGKLQERVVGCADEFSNKDLLDTVKVLQDGAEKSIKSLSEKQEIPMPTIQVNQQNNFGANLSDESRERILNYVNSVLGINNNDKGDSSKNDEK